MSKKRKDNESDFDAKLDEIKPYWRNPRKNDGAVDRVAASIKEFGMNQPIVATLDGVIIVGHTRYRALQQLGETHGWVLFRDLPPQLAKKYRIADNKTNEIAEWDDEKLIAELREIENIQDMQIYFGEDDVTELLKETAGASNFTDPTPDVLTETQGKLDTQFEGKVDASDEIPLACPHCNETFIVHKSDILRRFQSTADDDVVQVHVDTPE